MIRRSLIALAALALLGGCPETIRCPDGEFFSDGGACAPIPDAGPDAGEDSGPAPDGG